MADDFLMKAIFLIQVFSTLFMTGLIWIIQIVHYPLFAYVNPTDFTAYEHQHTTRITFIVGPVMLAELVTAIALLWYAPPEISRWLITTGLALVVVNWLSTATIHAPLHTHLSNGFDGAAIQRLVLTNWIRTAAWTLRGVIMCWMIWQIWEGGAAPLGRTADAS